MVVIRKTFVGTGSATTFDLDDIVNQDYWPSCIVHVAGLLVDTTLYTVANDGANGVTRVTFGVAPILAALIDVTVYA